ncbi:MAG: hypothetical protein GY751_12115 [Bacteroidetes bacterium]|nr:hypothetical protein [Bacteroidota bacterium]
MTLAQPPSYKKPVSVKLTNHSNAAEYVPLTDKRYGFKNDCELYIFGKTAPKNMKFKVIGSCELENVKMKDSVFKSNNKQFDKLLKCACFHGGEGILIVGYESTFAVHKSHSNPKAPPSTSPTGLYTPTRNYGYGNTAIAGAESFRALVIRFE